MKTIASSQKGFTLMELLVVVAILGVLMAVVGAAVTGIKSQSTDGQVKTDAKATQTAVDNYNNKSISTGKFPEVALSAGGHRYADVFAVGVTGGEPFTENVISGSGGTTGDLVNPPVLSGSDIVNLPRSGDLTRVTSNPGSGEYTIDLTSGLITLGFTLIAGDTVTATYTQSVTASGENVTLKDKSGNAFSPAQTLASTVAPSGGGSAVAARTVVDFTATTNTWDTSGAVKTSTFVPDLLLKEPTSLILKGDETKGLGSTTNTLEEYIWLMLVNASGTDAESRTVEIYRMSAATCDGGTCDTALTDVTALEYKQIF